MTPKILIEGRAYTGSGGAVQSSDFQLNSSKNIFSMDTTLLSILRSVNMTLAVGYAGRSSTVNMIHGMSVIAYIVHPHQLLLLNHRHRVQTLQRQGQILHCNFPTAYPTPSCHTAHVFLHISLADPRASSVYSRGYSRSPLCGRSGTLVSAGLVLSLSVVRPCVCVYCASAFTHCAGARQAEH